ncbi:MAG: N-acetyltransferase family protein [Geminicoccaceae bacterium]
MSAPAGQVAVRRATAEDAGLLTGLIDELNAHQGEETGRVTAEAVRRGGFGLAPEFAALLAERDGAVVGYALFHPTWSTEAGEPGFFLYDLFVRDSARGHGVGRALMRALAATARAEGRTFLWWTAKAWNQEALTFYRGFGASEEDLKAFAVQGEALERLAGGER